MKRLASMVLAGLVVVVAPAMAEEITVAAPIQSVVVFPRGASITRELAFELPAGESVLVVDNLPTGIDTSSIRVEGIAGGGAEIRSVVVRSGKTSDSGNPERVRIVEAIGELRDQLDILGDDLNALEAQRRFIDNLIVEGPGGFAELLGGQGGGIDQWQTAWEAIGAGISMVQANIRQVTLEQREIDQEIDELLDELASLPTELPHLEVLIETAATTATEGVMSLTYRVDNARWIPAYDAQLTTGTEDQEPTIELVRRAEIVQSTGEDWTDVALTLSTSRPTGGTAAPDVDEAQLVAFDQEGRLLAPAQAAEAAARDDDGFGMLAGNLFIEMEAVADFGDFKADYIIPVPVTVPSGGGTRSVRITKEFVPVRLFVETSPRLSEQAFLTAAFTIESQAPILAGRVNLFRDDAFVGTGNLAFANPGEEVELGFGPDDQVRVTWTLVTRSTGQRGLLTRIEFDEREYRATIINGHSRAIEITVVDRVPFSDDERIVVDVLPETTEPTEEVVDGRRGVVAWTYEYEPGETREITNAYVMSWPADLVVYGAN